MFYNVETALQGVSVASAPRRFSDFLVMHRRCQKLLPAAVKEAMPPPPPKYVPSCSRGYCLVPFTR